jgi:predicted DNA-binding mobile mystery protein A
MRKNSTTRWLNINQLDQKALKLGELKSIIPAKGWIYLIREILHISLKQLGNKLGIKPQSVSEMEKREADGALTLRSLKEVAAALDMNFVYGFIPKDGSLEKLIERKAREMAEKIVKRTSVTMQLEDQGNSPKRIKKAIDELTEELKREIPKSLWD